MCGISVGFEDGEVVCVACWGVDWGFWCSPGLGNWLYFVCLGRPPGRPRSPSLFPFCLCNFLFPLLLLLSFLPSFCLGLVVPLLFHFVAVSLRLINSRSICFFLPDHRTPVSHSPGFCALWFSCMSCDFVTKKKSCVGEG